MTEGFALFTLYKKSIRKYNLPQFAKLPRTFHVLILCVCVFVSPPYQDLVGKYSQQMVKGMLQLLSNCPSETAHLRKELLIAAKHILTTDLRSRMFLYIYINIC